MAEDYKMKFFETSAKTNQNVTEVFDFLTKEILKNNDTKNQGSGVGLRKDDKKDENPFRR